MVLNAEDLMYSVGACRTTLCEDTGIAYHDHIKIVNDAPQSADDQEVRCFL
jgi:hypothetical protein